MSLKEEREQMFDGRFDHNLDDKGRFLVPIQYRKLISDGEWYAIRSQNDRAIEVYPKTQGLALKKKIEKISAAEASGPRLKVILWMKRIAKESKEIKIDNQNRMLLPKYMRKWAEINDEAVIIGTDRGCFEVWNSTVYDETMDKDFFELEGREDIIGDLNISLDLPVVETDEGITGE